MSNEAAIKERLALKNKQLSEIHIAFCELVEAPSHSKKRIAKKALYKAIKESFKG